jgi:DNA adenine methylase
MASGINKAFLKWAGGKRTSLPMINKAIGWVDGRLIEPFAGSAVVSLNIEAFGYVLADLNEDLINLYELVRTESEEFIYYCESFFTDENNKEKVYYGLRQQFNRARDKRERAALFVYLNRHSFNGLCRYNAHGFYNVPYGKYKKVRFPKKEMMFFAQKAKVSEIYCQGFEETIKLAKPEDIVYCDPPYIPLNDTAMFTDYTSEGFTMEQHEQLAKLAEESECKFLISNHSTEFTKELYKKAEIIERDVGRFVGASKDSRKPVKELLAIYN